MPTTRRCPQCRTTYPLDTDHFYRSSGGRWEYCVVPRIESSQVVNGCHDLYWRRVAARRRNRRKSPGFGIEIEFARLGGREVRVEARDVVVAALVERGLSCMRTGYTHLVTDYWKIVTDASVPLGGELVSPPLQGARGLADVRTACEALESVRARVNVDCSVHVHVAARSPTRNGTLIDQVLRAWLYNQSLIHGLVAPSRRNGSFCGDIELDDIAMLGEGYSLSSFERYKAINVSCYPRYGTLEFRSHQGTTSADKICAWIEFVTSFMTWSTSLREDPPALGSHAELFSALEPHGLPVDTAAYLLERVEALRSSEPEVPEIRTVPVHAAPNEASPGVTVTIDGAPFGEFSSSMVQGYEARYVTISTADAAPDQTHVFDIAT